MSDDPLTRSVSDDGLPSAAGLSIGGLSRFLTIESTASHPDALLGCDIDGVTIVRLIAEGGMGRVYEGRQQKPHRSVAVKVMRSAVSSTALLRRFEYEAELLGRLRHPGIAHIYSAGVHRTGDASIPYFVMEYIADAKSLTAYAADLDLSTGQRLDLFRSVCDAVAFGHQRGVMHRDLKPGNILVDRTGQPKVIDFGVARATDSDISLTTMQTQVGQLLGTLQYMSPEQFDADPSNIDVRADVYALGVILYELLTGRLPYSLNNKTVPEAMRIVQTEQPIPISGLNKTLHREVARIAAKCLHKEPDHRYSSAAELSGDISRHLAGTSRGGVAGWLRGIVPAPGARPEAERASRGNGHSGPGPAAPHRATDGRRRLLAPLTASTVIPLAACMVAAVFAIRAERARQWEFERRQIAEAARDALVAGRGAAAGSPAPVGSGAERLSESRGDPDAAPTEYAAVMAVLDRLARQYPDNQQFARFAAATHAHLGGCLSKTGHSAGATAAYEAAVAMNERLARERPGPEQSLALAMAITDLGVFLHRGGDVEGGIAAHTAALPILASAAEERPDDFVFHYLLAATHHTLEVLHARSGDAELARSSREAAWAIRERLAKENSGAAQAFVQRLEREHPDSTGSSGDRGSSGGE